nr:MAG TPA: holin [Bacteriophage sp.]
MLATSALLSEVNWAVVGSSAAMAAIVSLLTSLAGLPEVKMQERERLRINKNTPPEDA